MGLSLSIHIMKNMFNQISKALRVLWSVRNRLLHKTKPKGSVLCKCQQQGVGCGAGKAVTTSFKCAQESLNFSFVFLFCLFEQFNHQGTITVNEEGTEAAAITTVGFMPLSTQIRFVIDRPFLFLIYEHRTSCLLFMGRVANPATS